MPDRLVAVFEIVQDDFYMQEAAPKGEGKIGLRCLPLLTLKTLQETSLRIKQKEQK